MLCVTIPTKISIRLDIRRGVVASDLHTKNYERSEVK